jgi:hypothetical protein
MPEAVQLAGREIVDENRAGLEGRPYPVIAVCGHENIIARMDGDSLIRPPLSPRPDHEPANTGRAIVIAILAVVALVAIVAIALREKPRPTSGPPAYATKLQITDLKMSQAQNFVGASVTYIDGTLTNIGDKTVSHVVVHVTFKDSYGQVAQIEDVPIRLLQTSGPYPDTVDLAISPLAPGQGKTFRLIFEHVSEQWGQGYPELQIADVTVK